MRIRSPHNPDILTYRDSIVYAPDHFKLDRRHISSNIPSNGTFQETYSLTLMILQVNLDDQGRYVCAKGRTIFAEYDLFIIGKGDEERKKSLISICCIVPPRFIEESLIPQQTVIEGSTLDLFCAAEGQPLPWITWFYRTTNNKLVLRKSTNQISMYFSFVLLSVGDGTPCRERLCHIHLPNYTRHDPSIIECIAENEKSSRISKIFKIDVFCKNLQASSPDPIPSIVDPPKIITHIRTLTKKRNIDVRIECSSIANPSPTISWFDENQQELVDSSLYTIEKNNHSSMLLFSVYSKEHSKVLYYCRSNNSLGIMEKLIDISGEWKILQCEFHREFCLDFIQFDNHSNRILMHTIPSTRKRKINQSTELIITTTISSMSSTVLYSMDLLCISSILIFRFY